MDDWRKARADEWRRRLNSAYDHQRELHIALRPLLEQPLSLITPIRSTEYDGNLCTQGAGSVGSR